MPQANRASLPEEFFDVTSPKLLVQPDFAMFHAQLFKMALGMSLLNLQQGGPLGVNVPGRPIPDVGAPYTSALYDRLQLMPPDPSYSAAVQFIPELGNSPGHTVRLNRPKYGSGGFTMSAREVPAGTTISTTAIDLGSEQVSLTLKRYGGPYDPVGGNVAPYSVDRFDSSVMLHSASQIVGKQLQRDLDRWLDQVMIALGNLASTTLWPQNFASDSTSTQVGDMPGDIDSIFRVEETMKNNNIPRFPNGKYMGVITSTFSRQLKNDPQFATYSRDNPYAGNTNPLFANFLARVGGIDLFESTSLISTLNGNSIPIYSSQFFGPSAWGGGMGNLPQVRANTQDNYGESAVVIWLWYMALVLMDSRFIVTLHTS
jgi:N4-gp56 family major capsid protein